MEIFFYFDPLSGDGDEKYYFVKGFDFTFEPTSTRRLANLEPGEIRMTLDISPFQDARFGLIKALYEFAGQQGSVASAQGKGKIIVHSSEEITPTTESVKEIKFEDGWITALDMYVNEGDSAKST